MNYVAENCPNICQEEHVEPSGPSHTTGVSTATTLSTGKSITPSSTASSTLHEDECTTTHPTIYDTYNCDVCMYLCILFNLILESTIQYNILQTINIKNETLCNIHRVLNI